MTTKSTVPGSNDSQSQDGSRSDASSSPHTTMTPEERNRRDLERMREADRRAAPLYWQQMFEEGEA